MKCTEVETKGQPSPGESSTVTESNGSSTSPTPAGPPPTAVKSESSTPPESSDGKQAPIKNVTSTPVKSNKSGKNSSEASPAMHSIRISASGFRQRWNGQQWRRLCDDPQCVREAQRLSRCARHQPVKEWRPARRSRTSLSKVNKALGMGQPGVDFQLSPQLLGSSVHPMQLSDPMFFPQAEGPQNLPMNSGNTEQQEETNQSSSLQWWSPTAGTMQGFPVQYSNQPTYSHAPGYSYENLALMYNTVPGGLEQLIPTWPVAQQGYNHLS